MSGETSSPQTPHDRLEGERKDRDDEVPLQDSNSGHVEHTVHEIAHDLEKPPRSPQLPAQLPTQPPTHEEKRVPFKSPPVAKRKGWGARKPWLGEERLSEEEWEKKRKLENAQRLEGQRLLIERKREERRKAEEVAAAAARAQTGRDECSTNGREHPSQRRCGSEDEEARRDQQRKPTVAVKLDDDQKVDNDGAKTIGVPEFQVLEHDTGATCLANTGKEHSASHLIMIAHPASAVSYAPPSPPITPTRYSSDSAFSHPGVGHCYYGNATSQSECQYQYGLVREDSQTGIESNYLFDPPILRWPSPKPVESVQTRQDATDVLFPPFLEQSGDSAGTTVITVILPGKKEQCSRNDGVSTTDTTHEIQKGRQFIGRGGHRGFPRGFRSRGRGGRRY